MADFLGALIGGAMGMANSALNAGYQRELAEQDRLENYMYNEMAAGNADKRTRALYNDFYSPGALLKQYKEAGLSPSLMFGGTPGQGGMSGAQGAGSAGIQTHYTPISFMEGVQAANIAAQTQKIKAETKTIEGENDRGRAEIDKIINEAKSVDLKNTWQEFNNRIEKINAYIAEQTAGDQVEITHQSLIRLEWETENLVQQVRNATLAGDITEAQKEDLMKEAGTRVANIAADTLLKKAQKDLARENITLTKQQVTYLIDTITNQAKGLEIKQGELDLGKDKLDQIIKEWAIENGIIIQGDKGKANWYEILQRNILGKKEEKSNGGIMGLITLLVKLAPK